MAIKLLNFKFQITWMFKPVIQNVTDPRRNGRSGKVFELVEPRFRRDMGRDFRIYAIFSDRDRNRILNHWFKLRPRLI